MNIYTSGRVFNGELWPTITSLRVLFERLSTYFLWSYFSFFYALHESTKMLFRSSLSKIINKIARVPFSSILEAKKI